MSEQSDSGTNRYLLGRIPFGPNHDRLLGRYLHVQYVVIRGFVFAGFLFGVAYWGNPQAVDSPLHLLVFISLMAQGMEGSVYQKQKRIANYIASRQGERDGE